VLLLLLLLLLLPLLLLLRCCPAAARLLLLEQQAPRLALAWHWGSTSEQSSGGTLLTRLEGYS
jgi:hypothetical protein